MPWDVSGDPKDFQPLGDPDALKEALLQLGITDGDERLAEAVERINESAVAFNFWRTVSGPTVKEVRDRLENVAKSLAAAVKAISGLDAIGFDFLSMNAGALPGASFLPRDIVIPDDWEAAASAFNDENPSIEGERAYRDYRSALRARLIGRIDPLARMAKIALREFNSYFHGLKGGQGTAVERIIDSAKRNFVSGLWDLITEHVDPKNLSASVETNAPFAAFSRAAFFYATGESTDDAGNNLDRQIRAVVIEAKKVPAVGYDQLNAALRGDRDAENELANRIVNLLKRPGPE